MSYRLDLGQWNSVFAVPSSVADKHLRLASGDQLKVLLYILRNAGEQLDDPTVAKACGIAPDEVANAVEFWTERGLLSTSGDELAPPRAVRQDSAIPAQQTEPAPQPKKHTAVSRAVRPDSAFVSRLMREDKSLSGLMEEAQSVMRKPLSPGDTATLVMLYDTFGLPCEVIAMLLHYVADQGHPNMRMVERCGIEWSDNGIFTVEAAEGELERMAASKEAWERASALMGVRNAGNPTKAQRENAHRWLYQWGFNDEMIVEAYERCVNTKGEYNMSYINAILKRWYEKKIFSLDALRAEESAAGAKKAQRNSKKNSSKGSVFSSEGASFDLSKYESQSIFDD